MLALKKLKNGEWPIDDMARRWRLDTRHDGWYEPVKLLNDDEDLVYFGDEPDEEEGPHDGLPQWINTRGRIVKKGISPDWIPEHWWDRERIMHSRTTPSGFSIRRTTCCVRGKKQAMQVVSRASQFPSLYLPK